MRLTPGIIVVIEYHRPIIEKVKVETETDYWGFGKKSLIREEVKE